MEAGESQSRWKPRRAAAPARSPAACSAWPAPACWPSCAPNKGDSTKPAPQHVRQEIRGFLSSGGVICAVWVYSVSSYFCPSSFTSLTGTSLLSQQNPLTPLLRAQHWGLQTSARETALTKAEKKRQSTHNSKQAC